MLKGLMPKTDSGEVLVSSESGDWYVIPKEKVEEWWDKWSFEDPPSWALYVQSPDFVTLYEWESTLR